MKKAFYWVLMTLGCTSCSLSSFRMDVLHPACFALSSTKTSILFVNNASPQPPAFGHVLYKDSVYLKDTSFFTAPLSDLLIESVCSRLYDANFFTNVYWMKHSQNRFLKKGQTDFWGLPELSNVQVRELSDSTKADILVSLDRMVVQSKTNHHNFATFGDATRDVKLLSLWRVFDVKADTLLCEFQYVDSLYWQKLDKTGALAMKNLPALEQTLPEMAEVLSEKMEPMLCPHWETVSRPYFTTGSIRMKMAVDRLRQNDWEAAAELWKMEWTKGYQKSAYRAAMNMMLYAEYLQTPDDALKWADKVDTAMAKCKWDVSARDKWLLYNWKEVLKTRSQEYKRLKSYFESQYQED